MHTTFDRFAELVDNLLDLLGVTRYAMYVMDYGAPVGWRLVLKHPERVTGLILQNGNAYGEGLKEFWDPIKAYWADGSDVHREALRGLLAPETTSFSTSTGLPTSAASRSTIGFTIRRCSIGRATPRSSSTSSTTIGPTCRFILPFRKHRPPMLIVWGKNDKISPADGAHPYKRDLPDSELHPLDTGHFALEDKADEVVPLIRDLLDRKIART